MEVSVGSDIREACENAVEYAIENNVIVEFDFNGEKIRADKYSNPDNLIDMFHNVLVIGREL